MKARAQIEQATGCLYLVGTPIGNLEDITLRALRVLKEADVIACEDTRQTQKLLNHYGIQKRLVSYHEHNELTRAAELVIELEQGARVALVSDAGMPLISDPGHRLVSLCLRHGVPVVPVPGPSAFVAALATSGLPADEFLFVGFLPARAGERRRALAKLAGVSRTLVFYEAPHRLLETLRDARELLGDRPAAVARELTKLHEEILRDTLDRLVERLKSKPPRGEITLLIGPPTEAPGGAVRAVNISLQARMAEIMREQGVDQKAALKLAARERGLTKREAYKKLLAEQAQSSPN
jgi:16S rRNA (cytidine1402-2'-O)-methyltransferase